MSSQNNTPDYTKYVWLQTVLLCFINYVNYMDRYNVSGTESFGIKKHGLVNIFFCLVGVLEEIEDEFGMTKQWQGGLLQTGFVILYTASAPVFGYLGDRYSRKNLIVFCTIAWSICTLTSSFMPVMSYNINHY